MIVSTMTEQEIRKELLVAKESTYSKLEIYKKKNPIFGITVLNVSG